MRTAAASRCRDGVEAPWIQTAAQILAVLRRLRQPHPLLQIDELAGRLARDDSVHHAFVAGETLRLLLENPTARFRAEQISPAIHFECAGGVAAGPDEQGREVAEVAQRRQTVGKRVRLTLALPTSFQLIPQWRVDVIPTRIFVVQPRSFSRVW